MDTAAFYDRISAVYDLLADAGERGCRDRGLSALNASPGERVLEVGCGTGHALDSLRLAVGASGQACGVDLSSGMMAVARRTLAGAGTRPIGLARNDARTLCFRTASFDAVFISFALELFAVADIPVVLAEIERVLRPAGRLAVISMAEADHPTATADVYRWLHRHFPHVVDCRPINVRALLGRAGFHPTREEALSIWGLPVAVVVAVRRDGTPLSSR